MLLSNILSGAAVFLGLLAASATALPNSAANACDGINSRTRHHKVSPANNSMIVQASDGGYLVTLTNMPNGDPFAGFVIAATSGNLTIATAGFTNVTRCNETTISLSHTEPSLKSNVTFRWTGPLNVTINALLVGADGRNASAYVAVLAAPSPSAAPTPSVTPSVAPSVNPNAPTPTPTPTPSTTPTPSPSSAPTPSASASASVSASPAVATATGAGSQSSTPSNNGDSGLSGIGIGLIGAAAGIVATIGVIGALVAHRNKRLVNEFVTKESDLPAEPNLTRSASVTVDIPGQA